MGLSHSVNVASVASEPGRCSSCCLRTDNQLGTSIASWNNVTRRFALYKMLTATVANTAFEKNGREQIIRAVTYAVQGQHVSGDSRRDERERSRRHHSPRDGNNAVRAGIVGDG
jgi:hypothetical protein